MIGALTAGSGLSAHIGTIVVGLILLAVVIAIVARGVYNKKRHKGGCGCGCENCANNGICHPKQP